MDDDIEYFREIRPEDYEMVVDPGYVFYPPVDAPGTGHRKTKTLTSWDGLPAAPDDWLDTWLSIQNLKEK